MGIYACVCVCLERKEEEKRIMHGILISEGYGARASVCPIKSTSKTKRYWNFQRGRESARGDDWRGGKKSMTIKTTTSPMTRQGMQFPRHRTALGNVVYLENPPKKNKRKMNWRNGEKCQNEMKLISVSKLQRDSPKTSECGHDALPLRHVRPQMPRCTYIFFN